MIKMTTYNLEKHFQIRTYFIKSVKSNQNHVVTDVGVWYLYWNYTGYIFLKI